MTKAFRSGPPHRERAIRFTLGPQEIVKAGIPRFDPRDQYHFAVSLSWTRFFLLFLAAELVVNALFAGLYLLQPGSVANQPRPGFLSTFFFSLETLATVGYGEMYPATLYGHIVSAFEIVTGIIFTAIVTGLLFVRFSRPKSGILYATHPVIARHDGKRTLMLRIGNTRRNPLLDLEVHLYVLIARQTAEGRQQVNVVELPLLRTHFPVFTLLWTAMHVIEDDGVLADALQAEASVAPLRFFFTVSARDPLTGQSISELHPFTGEDVRHGARYVDAIHLQADHVRADYNLLSTIEPEV